MKKYIFSLILAATTTMLVFAGTTTSNLRLSWKDPNSSTNQVQKFIVYRTVINTTNSWVKAGETTNKFFDFYNLTNGLYCFKVTALNLWGESEPSDVTNTPPSLPDRPTSIGLIKR